MSFRSSTSSSRRSLLLGALVCGLGWAALEASHLPRTAYYGGRRFAEKIQRLQEFEEDGPVDVFVVGPSHVDQGFDAERFTAVTGKRAFNLGIAGTDIWFQSILVRDLIASSRAPDAILWALRDEMLTGSNINRQYVESAAMTWARGDLGRWRYALGEKLPQWHRRRLRDWMRELRPSLARHDYEEASGLERAELRQWIEPVDAWGRTILTTATRAERNALRRGDPERGDERDELASEPAVDLATAQAHMAETLRLLRERDIEVWILFTPYARPSFARDSAYVRSLLTGTLEPLYGWITDVAGETGARIVDMRHCAPLTDDHELFFDLQHLNGSGAGPFAELVGRMYAGLEPVPLEWLGVPARAQLEAALGTHDPSRVPTLGLVEHHGVEVALQGPTDLYAAFRIERAGRYRVLLHGPRGDAAATPLFVRVGAGHHAHVLPRASDGFEALTVELEPGTHVLELHVAGDTPLAWSAFSLAP